MDAVNLLLSHDYSQPELVVDVPVQVSMAVNDRPAPDAAAAAGFDKIPEELTKNILFLSRLTAIELVRCKAVCKSWDTLISSPEFVNEHLKLTKSDPSSHHLLVCNSCVFNLDEYVPGPFNSVACFSSYEMVIVGSVNGLICTAGQSLQFTTTADDIWILNPATGLSRQLPLPSKPRLTYQTEAVLFAFWFDGGVYKLAKLVSEAEGPAVLEVWVSNSPDTWSEVTTLDFHFYPGIRFVRACDVLVEGFGAYWIVADYQENIFVIWLDLKALTLKSIQLSDEQTSRMPAGRSDLLAGLHSNVLFGAKFHGEFVVIQNGFTNDCIFYIWTMLMDGDKFGGWDLIQRIIFDFPFDRCLAWCINGRLVLESSRCVLTLIDMENGLENYLGEDYELENIFVDSGHDFVGSLVSIEGFKRNDLKDLYIGFSWPRDYPHALGRTCKKKM